MKVLMITQKIDKNDDILGIYHEWASAISKSFEKLSVICLYEGVNELPREISVFSLGKEKKKSTIRYIANFFSYIRGLRDDYDLVFVHMNPVYVLLGWFFWKLYGKKIFLWYAHPAWNWKVKLAYLLSDRVVTSVPEGFHIRGQKVVVTGHGIDTSAFSRNYSIQRERNSILSLGRLSPSKRIEVLLRAVSIIGEGNNFSLSIVGGVPPIRESEEYAKSLENFVQELGLGEFVRFHGAVPYGETARRYSRNELFINLSPTGHFDKTVLEAMACECVTIASNDAYAKIFPKDLHDILIFRQDDPRDLAQKIKRAISLSDEEKTAIGKRLREVVLRDHSLDTFGERLYKVFQNVNG